LVTKFRSFYLIIAPPLSRPQWNFCTWGDEGALEDWLEGEKLRKVMLPTAQQPSTNYGPLPSIIGFPTAFSIAMENLPGFGKNIRPTSAF
jgi:hypothetical protein